LDVVPCIKTYVSRGDNILSQKQEFCSKDCVKS
jgi:hypothetical protein